MQQSKTLKSKEMATLHLLYTISAIILVTLFMGSIASCSVVRTNYSNAAKKDATVYYYLPESLIKIHAVVKVAVSYTEKKLTNAVAIERTFLASSEIIADTKNLLSLNYKANAFMSDKIKYTVSNKGLLQLVNVTTEDKTAEIIQKLSDAPATIMGLAVGGRDNNPLITVKIKEYATDFVLKASDITADEKNIRWSITVYNESGEEEGYLEVPADFLINSADIITNPESLRILINGENDKQTNEINAILTRPLRNMGVVISVKTDIDTLVGLPMYVSVSDVSKLITIPVRRAAFVEKINRIEITDGILLSNEITKPSSLEGFIGIPINIAKALVSIPAQLIQVKISNANRLSSFEATKLSLEKSLQENKVYAASKEMELEKVKLEFQKATLTNEFEMKIVKMQLEKNIADAEKNRIEAQQALEKLKKEIEALKKEKK